MNKLNYFWKSLVKILRFILLLLLWSFILVNRFIETILLTIEAYWTLFSSTCTRCWFKISFCLSTFFQVVTPLWGYVSNGLTWLRIRILVYQHKKQMEKKYKQEQNARWINEQLYEVIPNKVKAAVRYMTLKEESIINKYTLYIRDHISFKIYYCGFLLRYLIQMYYSEFERFILYVHNKKFQATLLEWYILYYIYEYYFWPFIIILILYELRMFFFLAQVFIMGELYPLAAGREGKQKYGHKKWFKFTLFFSKYVNEPYYTWTPTRVMIWDWIHYFYRVIIILGRFETICLLTTLVIFSPVSWTLRLIKACTVIVVMTIVKFFKTTPFEKIIIKTAFDLEKTYFLKINEYIEWREGWKAYAEDKRADLSEWSVYMRVNIERSMDETAMDIWLLVWWLRRNIFLKYQAKKLIVRIFIADIRRIIKLYYYFCFLWQIFVLKTQFLWVYETVFDFPFYLIALTWIHYWEFFKVSMIIEAFLVTEFYLLYLSYRYKEVPITIIDSLLISRYLIWGSYKVEILKLKFQLFRQYPFCEIYWVRVQIRFWRLVIVWLKFTQVVYITGRVILNIIDLLTLGGLSYLKLWIMDRYWTSFFYYYINGHKKKNKRKINYFSF